MRISLQVACCALLLFVAAPVATSQPRSTCAEVYAGNVSHISLATKQRAEYGNVFDQHCESNGELKSKAQGFDFTVPVKKIDVTFHGTNNEAKQKMQEFCKSHHAESVALASEFNYDYKIAVDALTSFNQCIYLEGNGVYVSHAIQEPRSVIVRFDFNPDKATVRFQDIVYDSNAATCSSTAFRDGGEPSVLVPTKAKERQMQHPFSISCERKPASTKDGRKKLERFALGIATNQGTYSVVMQPEEVLGFDLASQNELRARQLETSIAAYKEKLAKVDAEVHLVRMGQRNAEGFWESETCPQFGGNLQTHMQKQCGARKLGSSKRLVTHGGDRCGYNYYAYTCLAQ